MVGPDEGWDEPRRGRWRGPLIAAAVLVAGLCVAGFFLLSPTNGQQPGNQNPAAPATTAATPGTGQVRHTQTATTVPTTSAPTTVPQQTPTSAPTTSAPTTSAPTTSAPAPSDTSTVTGILPTAGTGATPTAGTGVGAG
jgi:hypothetical protein